MTILVTGAGGFVGRTLCRDLRDRHIDVRAAVRDLARAGDLGPDIVCVPDLAASYAWTPALEGVSSVVHLAARVHVMKDTAADPLAAFRRVNVDGSAALAHAAADAGVKRLVYVSSVKVNGEATNGAKFSERDEPRPEDAYGVSKWEAEQILREISAARGLELVIVRPPLVYGPGVGGNFLRLLKLVRSGVPLPFGAVDNARSLVFVRNLTDVLTACATREEAAGKTFLVSDGQDLTTAELVNSLAQLMRQRTFLVPVPARLLRIAGRCAGRAAEVERLIGSLLIDSSQVRAHLGWKPPFTVAEGLMQTVRWHASLTN
jgi:nucleoside-diphosphate-sugar epimerase